MITPSNEFRTAGPIKQDLTSHVGPIILSVCIHPFKEILQHVHFLLASYFDYFIQMFVSTHYVGKEVGMKFRDGEPWEKVFGPVLVYLNSVTSKEGAGSLWEDAKEQVSLKFQKTKDCCVAEAIFQ